MLTVNRAILHSFDFNEGTLRLSNTDLNVQDRVTRSFVQRHLRRAQASADCHDARFDTGSNFYTRLRAYLTGEGSFVELSQEIAQWFWEELRKTEELEQTDLLVCEFEENIQVKVDAAITDEELAASFEGKKQRKFALMLLPRRQGFIHDVTPEAMGIARIDALLPNPTQKLDSFLIVDEDSFEIIYNDKARGVAGLERMLIPDGFLQCESAPSTREAVETLTTIVRKVAEEYGREPAVLVSQAKAAVARAVNVEECFSPAEIGREVFEQDEELYDRYEASLIREHMPQEVSMRRGLATRLTKNHRIRTDTGIEISFPAELAERDGYIEFVRDESGRLSIIIKGVAIIENR